jgi:O-antigen/teichoic acid export membrane protein
VPLSLIAPRRFVRTLDGIIAEHLLIWAFLAMLLALGFGVFSFFDHSDLMRLTFLSLIPSFMLLMSVDVERIVSLKTERYTDMVVLNALYVPVIVLGAWLSHVDKLDYRGFCFLIAGYALIRSLWVLFRQARPNIRWGWRLLMRDCRRDLLRLGVGTSISATLMSVPIFALGYFAPAIHTAAFVATRSLIQPIDVLFRGLDVLDKHRISQIPANDMNALRRAFFKTTLLYGLIATLFVCAIGFWAQELLHLVYKGVFDNYIHAVWLWGVVFMLTALLPPLESLIFKAGKAQTYNLIQIVAGGGAVLLTFVLVPFNWPFSYENGAIVTRILTWLILLGACYIVIIRPTFISKA